MWQRSLGTKPANITCAFGVHHSWKTCWQILHAATYPHIFYLIHTHVQFTICIPTHKLLHVSYESRIFASFLVVFGLYLPFLQAIFLAKRCLICLGVFCALAISFALSSIWLIAFGMHRATQWHRRTHSKVSKKQYATCHMPQYSR